MSVVSVVSVEAAIPEWLWWELAGLAESRQVKVGDVVADAIWAHVLPLSRRAREERIAELHASHHSVAAISRELGMNRESVATLLRSAS